MKSSIKICSSNDCCAGSMTGHGIPQGFCLIKPFKHFGKKADALNEERRKLGHATKLYHLNAAIHGKLVPLEKRDEMMLASGHACRYVRAREESLYVTTSMRRSWRRRGVSTETYERFVRNRQRATWSATRENHVSWETPEETRRKCGVKL